jgi:hypothetical protein
MIPESIDLSVIENNGSYQIDPSLTYKLDFTSKRIMGYVDERMAVFQAVHKILSTDRYSCVIYDWSYGHELIDLVGQDFGYICAELPRIVEEALTQDERITGVSGMQISKKGLDVLEVSFSVDTIFGSIPYSMEVLV